MEPANAAAPQDAVLFPRGGLVFDIGAHHGESAARFLSAGAGKVVAVEPCFPNFMLLRSRFFENDRVVPIHAGIDQIAGIRQISMAGRNDGLSTMELKKWNHLYPDADHRPPKPVACLTLHDLMVGFGRPHYVKIDVEGMEKRVLSGLTADMSLPTVISFEFHGATLNDTKDCLLILEELGYTNACYREAEPDLFYGPDQQLLVVLELLKERKPNWGNITVSR